MSAEISGWGRYPAARAQIERPLTIRDCVFSVCDSRGHMRAVIARGLGRSYGDSSLGDHVLDMTGLDHFHQFDADSGLLTCGAGVSLAEIVRLFLPRGWFLPVTPGTRFVTLGGAIASDVHGKNHHLDGTFGMHVVELQLLLGNGEIVTCSRSVREDLFSATCGGMGLTGVILSATIRLRRVQSAMIDETIIRVPCLPSLLEQFEENSRTSYSVAWIDCLASGRNLGRSLLMLGRHSQDGGLTISTARPMRAPLGLLAPALNSYSIKAFNALYYGRLLRSKTRRRTRHDAFFYPLDKLEAWNRLYGKAGFLQYQFVIPKTAGLPALQEILKRIVDSGRGSFLAVLKVFGAANQHLLSFPIEGYTLALDFKYEPNVLELLRELDRQVLSSGGRLYLAKDARMSEETFKQSYPTWEQFEHIRERYYAHDRFASRQSRRLGLR